MKEPVIYPQAQITDQPPTAGQFIGTPVIMDNRSDAEKDAQARKILEEAETEKENRTKTIIKRYAIGGCVGFLAGFILGIVIF